MIILKHSKAKIALIVLSFVALAAAFCGAAALFLAMEREYDPAIHHFEIGAVFAMTATAICAGGLLLAVAGFCIPSKKLSFAEKGAKNSFFGIFSSVLSGLMCGLLFCVGVQGGIPEEKPGVLLAELTFTVLSAVYFFLKAFGAFSKKPALSLFGLLPALMCAFMILDLYFNASEPLNAPLKIFEIIMLVSFMFYFTAEAGVNILHPKMGRKFAFAGILAIACGGMVAVARLSARIVNVEVFKFDIIRCSFYAIIWLCITVSFLEKMILAREIKEDNAFFDNEDGNGEEKSGKDKDGSDDIPVAEPDEEDASDDIPVAEPDEDDEPEEDPSEGEEEKDAGEEDPAEEAGTAEETPDEDPEETSEKEEDDKNEENS